MSTNTIAIVFHHLDYQKVKSVSHSLTPLGFTFHPIEANNDLTHVGIADPIVTIHQKVIVFLSEKFLTDANCIYQWHNAMQQIQLSGTKQLFLFVSDPNLHEEVGLTTVGDVLYYINYWQDTYLQARKKYLTEDRSLLEANEDLKQLREIASDVGESLHFIRKQGVIELEEFQANNYRIFFDWVGLKNSVADDESGDDFDEKDELIQKRVEALIKRSLPESHQNGSDEEDEKTNDLDQSPESDLLKKLQDYKNGVLSDADKSSLTSSTDSPTIPSQHPERPIDADVEKLKQELAIKLGMTKNELEQTIHETPLLPSSLGVLREKIKIEINNIPLQLELVREIIDNKEHFTEATDVLENVLKQDRNNLEAIYLLSQLCSNVGEFKLARTYLERLISLQPDYPGVYEEMGDLLVEHFPLEQEEAAKFYKKAYQHDTKKYHLLDKRAKILQKLEGKRKKAIKTYLNLLEVQPDHPSAHFHLAELYLELGDRMQAKFHFAKGSGEEVAIQNFETEIPAKPIEHVEPIEAPIIEPKTAVNVATRTCITGATSGIGKATARLLASQGYDLLLIGRRKAKLEELQLELEEAFEVDVEILSLDVTEREAVEYMVEKHTDIFKNVNILINNAGLALGLDYIHEANMDHWDRMIDTNVKGLLYMTRLIAPFMVAKKTGFIINICSTAGKEVYPKGNVYCASKFAVDALTRSMRQDLFKHGIRVGQVSPGATEDTEFAKVRFEGDDEKAKIYSDYKPLRASDIARIIHFMILQPSHVNIQDVLVMSSQQASATLYNRNGRD